MRLNVSDIPDNGLQQEIELPIKLNDDSNTDIAHAFIKLFRFGEKVLVDGSIEMSVSLKCSRCLKDFHYPLDVIFREEYSPVEEIVIEEEHELTGKELDLSYYKNDEIDISELIKEQVLLSIPMKALCKSECKGMCPRCGKDLNEVLCNCVIEKTDPRLTPLKKFKELMNDRKE